MQRRGFLATAAAGVFLAACDEKKSGTVMYADTSAVLPSLESVSANPYSARVVTTRVSEHGDLVAAIQSLPAAGGVIAVDMTLYLTATVDVPHGVELVGAVALPGSNSDSSNINRQHLQQQHILVARGVSPAFRVHGASGIAGLFLHKEGVDFGTESAVMFADDAVHIVGEDAYVDGCFITGFYQAVRGTFVQRSRITNNRVDCVNGIWLERVFDIARIADNHLWPFVTVEVNTPESAWREGVAFRFNDGGDWNQLRGNFCFGFATGYLFENVEHITAVQCGADSFPAHRRGVGFRITGKAKNIALIACQAAGQRVGFLTDTGGTDKPNQMIGCSHWGNVANVVGWN